MEDEMGGAYGMHGDKERCIQEFGRGIWRREHLEDICVGEDNIKMNLKEIECEGVDWIDVVQVRGKWWALLNSVKVA